MPTWLVQLLDARTLFGVVLGVAATAIAIWLQARVEHGRWLRQQRLEAFATFIAALDACTRPRTRWQLSWGTAQEDTCREAFWDAIEALDRASGRIGLLSHPPVNEATIRAYRQWSIGVNGALKSRDAAGLETELTRAEQQYQAFLRVARLELGQSAEVLSAQAIRQIELEDDSARLVDLNEEHHPSP